MEQSGPSSHLAESGQLSPGGRYFVRRTKICMHILPSAYRWREHNKHLVPRYFDQARAHGEGSGAKSDNVSWDRPRAVMYTSGPSSVGCHLWYRSKLQEGADLV